MTDCDDVNDWEVSSSGVRCVSTDAHSDKRSDEAAYRPLQEAS
jgi:hypothetical protein